MSFDSMRANLGLFTGSMGIECPDYNLISKFEEKYYAKADIHRMSCDLQAGKDEFQAHGSSIQAKLAGATHASLGKLATPQVFASLRSSQNRHPPDVVRPQA